MTWQTAKKRVVKFLADFGVRCSVGFFALTSFFSLLVHFHILPEKWEVFPVEQLPALSLVAGLIWIVSEQLHDIKEETNGSLTTSATKYGELGNQVNCLISNLSPRLHLLECIKEYKLALDQFPSDEKITVDHLGLDMHIAWGYIREYLICSHGDCRKLNYRLLLLSDDPSLIGNATNEIQSMCNNAKYSLQQIKAFLAAENHRLSELNVEIKTYTEFPVVHGFRANKPHAVHYVSFFRWVGYLRTEYNWGEGRYHRVKSAPENSSLKDLADIFDGYFEHLWSVSKPVYPEPKSVNSSSEPDVQSK